MSTSVELALWENYMKAGQSAIRNKNALEAESMFTLAWRKCEWLGEAQERESIRWLVLAYCEQKNWSRAERTVSDYLEMRSDDGEITDMVLLLSYVYELHGNAYNAAKVLEQLLRRPSFKGTEQFTEVQAKYQRLWAIANMQDRSLS